MKQPQYPPKLNVVSIRFRPNIVARVSIDRPVTAGDLKGHILDFAVQKESDGCGSDWHPSSETHEPMASELVGAIETAIEW